MSLAYNKKYDIYNNPLMDYYVFLMKFLLLSFQIYISSKILLELSFSLHSQYMSKDNIDFCISGVPIGTVLLGISLQTVVMNYYLPEKYLYI